MKTIEKKRTTTGRAKKNEYKLGKTTKNEWKTSTVLCIYDLSHPQNPGQNPDQKSGQKPGKMLSGVFAISSFREKRQGGFLEVFNMLFINVSDSLWDEIG